jgi:hypothetical protein
MAIDLTINQHIHLGLEGNPFRLNVVFRELLELKILQQLLRPEGSCSFSSLLGKGL